MIEPPIETLSPMMLQWKACKEEAPSAILLFRLGDFYEAFFEDALTCSKILDLTLTKRQNVPMSGMPAASAESYIEKLVATGYSVAIAEQVEEAGSSKKGILERKIVRVVSPGTFLASDSSSEKANNYIASLTEVGSLFGITFLDLSTGSCRLTELNSLEGVYNEFFRMKPKEILTTKKFQEKHFSFFETIKQEWRPLIDHTADWRFGHEIALAFLKNHFKVHSLDGFGLIGKVAAINAAGALLSFVQENLKGNLSSIQSLIPYSNSETLAIDPASRKTLELTESTSSTNKKNTLLNIMDYTLTPMGGRLLRRYIQEPLQSIKEITLRQDSLEEALNLYETTKTLRLKLSSIRDLERVMAKILSKVVSPKDLVQLKHSLKPISEIKEISSLYQSTLLKEACQNLNPLSQLIDLLENSLAEEPPLRVSDGGAIKSLYNQELDDLRSLAKDSKSWMLNYQEGLKEKTGIKTLKVGYTRVFGFYIEISKGQAENAPKEFIRRQTLTTGERFITEELKAFEEKILSAEEKILAIETTLFQKIKEEVESYSREVFKNAEMIAIIDTLLSLAHLAEEQNYKRPLIHSGKELIIKEGRHPVIEASNLKEKFTPNDTELREDSRMMIITGPNMAGKSTYIRQVALICIMAHMGSFVPATEAQIPIIDKIFTRIGASDDLSRGQSTFMVEMTETSNILHHATEKSLVILDEIGRGTSTYDGISLAYSIAEYLLDVSLSKTLFATHYFELTKLAESDKAAVNYNVAVHEGDEGILFLRKIVKGCTDKSYGIHVAKLAGLPPLVISRAKEILKHLEESALQKNIFEVTPPPKRVKKEKGEKPCPKEVQLSLF